jgi:hypothetical protein
MSLCCLKVGLERHARMITEARQELDEAAWTAAWDEGRGMCLDQAIAYALGEATSQNA